MNSLMQSNKSLVMMMKESWQSMSYMAYGITSLCMMKTLATTDCGESRKSRARDYLTQGLLLMLHY